MERDFHLKKIKHAPNKVPLQRCTTSNKLEQRPSAAECYVYSLLMPAVSKPPNKARTSLEQGCRTSLRTRSEQANKDARTRMPNKVQTS